MFSQALPKTISRARRLSLAAVVGLLGTSVAAGTAYAGTGPAGTAVIASPSGVAIDTTSGATAAPRVPDSRSSSKSSGNALTLNPSGPVTASTSRPSVTKPSSPAKTPGVSQVNGSNLEAPIVDSPGHRQASPASLAQIQSSGPIVAASGTPPVTGHAGSRRSDRQPTPVSVRQPSPVWFMTAYRYHAVKAPIPVVSTVDINAPGVHVFISQTSARRPTSPAARSTPANPAVVRQIGTPGTGLAGLLSSDPRPAPTPGGPANTLLFGNASGPAGVVSLLGIDTLLTIAVLLVGAAWRRRAWDLPVLPSQSALLAMALDRPG